MTQEYKAYDRNGVEIKVGDKVKMVAYKDEIKRRDMNGMGKGMEWKNDWADGDKMDNVGEIFTVSRISSYGMTLDNGDNYQYPSAAFENLSVEEQMPIELKPFMRVRTSNGEFYIVIPTGSKSYGADTAKFSAVNKSGNHTRLTPEAFKGGGRHQIVEIYADPGYNNEMLIPERCGELLWKAKDEQAIQKAKEAVEKAQQQMKEATKALEEAQKQLAKAEE